jgi:hypothetical protein
MRDLKNNLLTELSLYLQALTAAANGDAIIDLQGFEGALIEIFSGTITDGTLYTFELKHGNDSGLSDAAAVPDADLIGTEPSFAAATEDDTVKTFGYVGNKRYLRVDLKTVTGSPSTGGVFGAAVVKGIPRHAPVA